MPEHKPTVFINLAISNLQASEAFYEALGFKKQSAWCDETTSCMALSSTIAVMIMEHPRFKSFMPASKNLVSGRSDTECLLCFTVPQREDVDRVVDAGDKAGGKKDPTTFPEMPGMYGRSVEDPDGHIWELSWMEGLGDGIPTCNQEK